MSLNTTINRDQGAPYLINVFLSHDWGERVGNSHVNHEKVRKIKNFLVSLTENDPKYRLKIWFDENELAPGHNIALTLKRAIEDCNIFIYFVTRNYQSKYLKGKPEFCHLELEHARKEKKIKIPVILEEAMTIEANRKGTFAQIISGIFYSDFSTAHLFDQSNLSLLNGRCQDLVNAIKIQYDSLDFCVNGFLEEINNLNPNVLIHKKFNDIEQYLQNLLKSQISRWNSSVKEDISAFYETINDGLSNRFKYLKEKGENRNKLDVLDCLKNSISYKLSHFRNHHEKQCQQFFTDLTSYINILLLSEKDRLDNCSTIFHRHYVSSYENFQALRNEFNRRAEMLEEHSRFTMEQNRSFSQEFHAVCNRFLKDLQALASIPDDPIVGLQAILQAIVDFQRGNTPNPLYERHSGLFLECLKYYNETVGRNGEYYPYPILQSGVAQSNVVDDLHSADDERRQDKNINNNETNCLTLFFNELCDISELHYPLIYRIRNKQRKFDWTLTFIWNVCSKNIWNYCYKNISFHALISYVLDIAAVCCGFVAFNIMLHEGYSDSDCDKNSDTRINYCYLDDNLSYNNDFINIYSCLAAIYAVLHVLFDIKVMLWKSSWFWERILVNSLGFVAVTSAFGFSLTNLVQFVTNKQSVSGIYALTSGYCYDYACSNHGALTSEGLTSTEIAASVACFNQTIGKGAVTACATRSGEYFPSYNNADVDDHCVFFHGILTMDDIEKKEDTLYVVMILVAIFIPIVCLQWSLFVRRTLLTTEKCDTDLFYCSKVKKDEIDSLAA
eukprot:gene9006-9752_t